MSHGYSEARRCALEDKYPIDVSKLDGAFVWVLEDRKVDRYLRDWPRGLDSFGEFLRMARSRYGSDVLIGVSLVTTTDEITDGALEVPKLMVNVQRERHGYSRDEAQYCTDWWESWFELGDAGIPTPRFEVTFQS